MSWLVALFPSEIYASRRLLSGVYSPSGKICAKARAIHLTAITHRPGIFRPDRSQRDSTSLGFKPLSWRASSLSKALFEEEAYSSFPKCSPMRQPRHLKGLGLGLQTAHCSSPSSLFLQIKFGEERSIEQPWQWQCGGQGE
jgi:hypothetical protein